MPDHVDELYGLPLDEFTAARNALVKRLKKDGDKEAAAQVQALKKPSVAAWALNRVARDDPAAIDDLLEAGAAVRQAHRQALQGDASALRSATRAEQKTVSALAQRAAAVLDEAGSSGAAQAERLSATLRAAATDEEAGELLKQGRLVSDLDASGFDTAGGLALVPAPSRQRETEGAPKSDDADAEAEADAAAAAEREAAERQARRERERARARAAAAAEKAERLEREADRAEEVAQAARERADEARKKADEAVAEAT